MKIILLSGGSGMRLWPLSNASRSKQFLKVLNDEKNQKVSMMQRVYGQLCKAGYAEDILIATNENQVEAIKDQLGQTTALVIEPERRNTFAAIALAVAHLHFIQAIGLEETIVVLPIDVFAEEAYFNLLTHLEAVIQEESVAMALMGVYPTYPSEKYGYIVPETKQFKIEKKHLEKEILYQKVKHFKEKPSLEEAKRLIKQEKALWNCGVFAFKLGYVLDALAKDIAFTSYADVLKNYAHLENISFDYKLIEKAKSIAVVTYDGIWKDLGTWNTLCEEMREASVGEVVLSETSKNVHVINELEIPTLVIGIQNAVVVATPDGILVSDKHESSYLKNYLGEKALPPMVEKKHWGRVTILDCSKNGQDQQKTVRKLEIKAGKSIFYSGDRTVSKIWTVFEGTAIYRDDEASFLIESKSVIQIKAGNKHAIQAMSDLVLIEIRMGETEK